MGKMLTAMPRGGWWQECQPGSTAPVPSSSSSSPVSLPGLEAGVALEMVKGSMQGNHREALEKQEMVLTKASISLQEQDTKAIRPHVKPTLKDKQINLTPGFFQTKFQCKVWKSCTAFSLMILFVCFYVAQAQVGGRSTLLGWTKEITGSSPAELLRLIEQWASTAMPASGALLTSRVSRCPLLE